MKLDLVGRVDDPHPAVIKVVDYDLQSRQVNSLLPSHTNLQHKSYNRKDAVQPLYPRSDPWSHNRNTCTSKLEHKGRLPSLTALLRRKDQQRHPSRRVQSQHPYLHHSDLCHLQSRPPVRRQQRCSLRNMRGVHLRRPGILGTH